MEFQQNVPLRNYTTFRIGGRAKYFYLAKTKDNLVKAILMAKKLKLPFFILGGGSNLLISDKGIDELVIKIQNTKYKILRSRASSLRGGLNIKIFAEAGVLLGKLVNVSLEKKLTGLEWAAGIPGTVGGAIYGNAGAFGKSMKDVVEEVEVFEAKNQKIKILKNKNCKFTYRDSVFKKNKNLIILSLKIQLKKGSKKAILRKIKKYLAYKKTTQPQNYPFAGSVFKNFTPYRPAESGTGAGAKELRELKKFKKTGTIPAAWLIEKCGLKGKKIGKAEISEKHANFIVNLGKAKAKDVKKLINLAKKMVKNKFKINLEEEIQYLNH